VAVIIVFLIAAVFIYLPIATFQTAEQMGGLAWLIFFCTVAAYLFPIALIFHAVRAKKAKKQ
jgi:hypothetical protein